MAHEFIYHLALAEDWGADADQPYATSTLGASLAEQDYIHCSFGHQVQTIADVIYHGRSDVLLLTIDPARLDAEVRVECLEDGGEAFPHVYGPLNRDAVVRVAPLPVLPNGRLEVASFL